MVSFSKIQNIIFKDYAHTAWFFFSYFHPTTMITSYKKLTHVVKHLNEHAHT